MKHELGKCPVKYLIQPSEPSRCPLTKLMRWFWEKYAHITNKLPYRVPNPIRDELVRVSSTYSALLIKHKQWVIQELSERMRKWWEKLAQPGKTREEVLEEIFLEHSLPTQTLLLILVEIDVYHEKDFAAIAQSEDAYMRAQNAYQIWIQNVGKIWRILLKTYRHRYRRFPTPEELPSFREFVIHFITRLGESPGFFAGALWKSINDLGDGAILQINRTWDVRINTRVITRAQWKVIKKLKTFTDIWNSIQNGYCPALSMIPKITEMCCEAFEAGYANIYSLDFK